MSAPCGHATIAAVNRGRQVSEIDPLGLARKVDVFEDVEGMLQTCGRGQLLTLLTVRRSYIHAAVDVGPLIRLYEHRLHDDAAVIRPVPLRLASPDDTPAGSCQGIGPA
jgi:hypothetical protein